MTNRKWLVIILGIPLLCFLLGAGYILTMVFEPSTLTADEAYARFLTFEDGAEDQNMDPLILAGEKVIPLVLEGVQDPNMPRRRYAIGFLGNCECKEAIPLLLSILADAKEKHYFRGDALKAIARIHPERGKELAAKYQNAQGHLGHIAGMVLKDDPYITRRRTFSDALQRRHD